MCAMMPARLTLTPRELGSMVIDDFCPRCFWLGHGLKAPFQIPMPGVFSRIDSLAKHQVDHAWLDLHAYPDYLGLNPTHEFPVAAGLLDWRKFQTTLRVKMTNDQAPMTNGRPTTLDARRTTSDDEPTTEVILRGTPDRVFSTNPAHPSGEMTIVDFKTSVFTERQDKLMPLYQVQLGCYAYIAESLGWGKVKRLALIYWQPRADEREALLRYRGKVQTGWAPVPAVLGFDPLVREVEIDFRQVIPRLVAEAAKLLTGPRPEKSPICRNCSKLDDLVRRAMFTFARHPEVVS